MEQTIQKTIDRPDDGWVTVEIHGDPQAETLLVIPGAMSDARAWRHVAGALTAWPTIAVLNRRGRPPSADLPADYSLATEVEDAAGVLRELPQVTGVFGWSYGGLIALMLADQQPLPQVIAYDPVMRPFGAHALADLHAADAAGDTSRTVEIVCGEISGMDAEQIQALRAQPEVWEGMRDLARPVAAETAAFNAVTLSALARLARRTDLIVGGLHQGRAPYGTSFEDVRALVPHAAAHELPGQGHMAHLEDPAALARVLDELSASA